MPLDTKLANEVNNFALDNYNAGWDFIVECYTLNTLAAELLENDITTLDQAKVWFKDLKSVLDDRRADAKYYAENY